jgi:hypothetical protein
MGTTNSVRPQKFSIPISTKIRLQIVTAGRCMRKMGYVQGESFAHCFALSSETIDPSQVVPNASRRDVAAAIFNSISPVRTPAANPATSRVVSIHFLRS